MGGAGSQPAVEFLDELWVGPGALRLAGPQLEGHPKDRGVIGRGGELLRRPVGQDRLYERLDVFFGHQSPSSASRAAIRKARYWRTLALLTLMVKARAESLME